MKSRIAKAHLPDGSSRLAIILDSADLANGAESVMSLTLLIQPKDAIAFGEAIAAGGRELDSGIVRPGEVPSAAWRPEAVK